MIMKKFLKTFSSKTSSMMKRVYKRNSHGFMKVYGPTIKAGLNPFM